MKINLNRIVFLTLACLIAVTLGACSAGPNTPDGGASPQQVDNASPADKESAVSKEIRGRVKSISGDALEIEALAMPPFPYIDENGKIPLANEDIEAFKKQVAEDGGRIESDDENAMMVVFNMDGSTRANPEAKAVKVAFTDDGREIGIVLQGTEKDLIKYTGETVEIPLTPDTYFTEYVEQNSRDNWVGAKDGSFLQVGDFVVVKYNDDGTIDVMEYPSKG